MTEVVAGNAQNLEDEGLTGEGGFADELLYAVDGEAGGGLG